jgi:hypothetical protein
MSNSPTHRHSAHSPALEDSEEITAKHDLKLAPVQTGMTISPELFEKLYLTPKVPHVGDAYKRFANP